MRGSRLRVTNRRDGRNYTRFPKTRRRRRIALLWGRGIYPIGGLRNNLTRNLPLQPMKHNLHRPKGVTTRHPNVPNNNGNLRINRPRKTIRRPNKKGTRNEKTPRQNNLRLFQPGNRPNNINAMKRDNIHSNRRRQHKRDVHRTRRKAVRAVPNGPNHRLTTGKINSRLNRRDHLPTRYNMLTTRTHTPTTNLHPRHLHRLQDHNNIRLRPSFTRARGKRIRPSLHGWGSNCDVRSLPAKYGQSKTGPTKMRTTLKPTQKRFFPQISKK